ncbi:hypothetical protein J6590_077381 [Homalodisca vitripennis]|nr:hypothetical protein J6590_077381 [Homalodisca vitripennis]
MLTAVKRQVEVFRSKSFTGNTLKGNPRVQRLSQDNRIKQRRAWLLLGWVTPERSCPCKQRACPAVGGGSKVIFMPFNTQVTGFLSSNFAR